jgi:hypothetical protein
MISLLLLAVLGQEPVKPDLVVNVDWAFGRPVAGSWQSILVDLQNPAPKDRELRAEIEDEITSTRVSRTETVPAGGRRRFHLTLPMGGLGNQVAAIQLRLRVSEGGREHATRTLANTGGWSINAHAVAVLTRDRTLEGAFRIPRRLGETDVVAVFPSTRTFPDHWTALAGIRLLALHDAPLSELLPDQARAILDYARRGGTVLLSPGVQREWFAHPVIAALAEIRTGEAERRTALPSFGLEGLRDPFLFLPILNGKKLVRGGVTLERPRGNGRDPMEEARSFDCGFGHVVALPFDVGLPPLSGSAGLEELWSLALTSTGENRPGGPSLGLSGVVSSLTALVNPYPSFALLVGLSALYLAAVGPLNYLLLRRLRMTILLVLTVPLISIVFLGAVLGVGYLLKGSSTVVCSIRLLATEPGLPVALESQIATVFSPESRAYRISFPRDRAPLPLERAVSSDFRQYRPISVTEGNDRAFDRVSIDQWQTWPVQVAATADLGRGIEFQTADGVLRVRNGTPHAVARGLHVRRVAEALVGTPFGAVEPGGLVEVPLAQGRWEPQADLAFGERSVGGAVIGELTGGLNRSSGGAGGTELLVCVLADDSPRIEVDGRAVGREHSLTLLTAWKEGR